MDDRISKVINYVESNLSKRLTLKDLSAIACMSARYFHRAFKKETGKTPFRFIEEIKMDQALRSILLGSKKVHELTFELGYRDYETFSRSFKKHHLIAPDDLKVIAQKIQGREQIGPENLIIKTIEVEDLDEIKTALDHVSNKLDLLLTLKELSEEEIKQAKLISVVPKESSGDKDNLVKNKFVIKEDKGLWQQLLKHVNDGDN
ncbi:MAG: AraC family transcriptional regulator [Reichenbachiella sp.]|uniref:helix-turn-helix transcriptional regulator n=1 Tax=Reichenbachiella sp. TaxID=2184521 RepID=UPI00326543FF